MKTTLVVSICCYSSLSTGSKFHFCSTGRAVLKLLLLTPVFWKPIPCLNSHCQPSTGLLQATADDHWFAFDKNLILEALNDKVSWNSGVFFCSRRLHAIYSGVTSEWQAPRGQSDDLTWFLVHSLWRIHLRHPAWGRTLIRGLNIWHGTLASFD